jgi:hypothetical protein
MSYHIEINEYQRRLIMKALTSTDVNQFSQAPGSGDALDTEAKESSKNFWTNFFPDFALEHRTTFIRSLRPRRLAT